MTVFEKQILSDLSTDTCSRRFVLAEEEKSADLKAFIQCCRIFYSENLNESKIAYRYLITNWLVSKVKCE